MPARVKKAALLALALGACQHAAPTKEPRTAAASPPAQVLSASSSPRATPSLPARLRDFPVRARPELVEAFDAERVHGTIALYDSASRELSASDPALAKQAFLPASTFKIANSIIALENGLLESPDSPLPWDGVYSENQDWNRDHTLRTAIQVSCVPCFQRVAKSIGTERMQTWLERLDYGNRDSAGGIELFWLTGALRISPIEQLDFLRRLDAGELRIEARTLDIVRDIMALDVGPSHVLYGKTGLLGGRPAEGPARGWFVGWVALEGRNVYFATLLDRHAPDVDLKPARRRVTERVLRSLGALPG